MLGKPIILSIGKIIIQWIVLSTFRTTVAWSGPGNLTFNLPLCSQALYDSANPVEVGGKYLLLKSSRYIINNLLYKGYYMATRRYEISLRVLKTGRKDVETVSGSTVMGLGLEIASAVRGRKGRRLAGGRFGFTALYL